jgi:hypothetical protein
VSQGPILGLEYAQEGPGDSVEKEKEGGRRDEEHRWWW